MYSFPVLDLCEMNIIQVLQTKGKQPKQKHADTVTFIAGVRTSGEDNHHKSV